MKSPNTFFFPLFNLPLSTDRILNGMCDPLPLANFPLGRLERWLFLVFWAWLVGNNWLVPGCAFLLLPVEHVTWFTDLDYIKILKLKATCWKGFERFWQAPGCLDDAGCILSVYLLEGLLLLPFGVFQCIFPKICRGNNGNVEVFSPPFAIQNYNIPPA